MRASTDHRRTVAACYIGYISQAIIVNFAPLLFVRFGNEFGLDLARITMLTTINFVVQLAVDAASVLFVDRLGYRNTASLSQAVCGAGLIAMAFLPYAMPPYAGLLIATVLYAVGGGLTEVVISPMIEACPTDEKSAAMSLLHSFYCWGQVGVILLSTVFFSLAGLGSWRILALLWAVIPLFNAVFFRFVPIYPIVPPDKEPMRFGRLVTNKSFLLLILLMLCSGASEQAVAQWASAFAETGLGISKSAGDLAGPCLFAVMMGVARVANGKAGAKTDLRKVMICSSALCVGAYILLALSPSPALGLVGCAVCGLSVGVMWPGTLSLAAGALPTGGTTMYALLALAGDLGCSAGPTVTGLAADAFGGKLNMGFAAAIVFPAVMLISLVGAKRLKPRLTA